VDVLTLRVAARHFRASLEHEFEHGIQKLISYGPDHNPPPAEVKEFRKWIFDNFQFQKGPKQYKREREELDRLWRFLEHGESLGINPGGFSKMVESLWGQMKSYLPTWVAIFSKSGGAMKPIQSEVKVGGNTYVNLVGASDDRLQSMIKVIEEAFGGLKGWRRKALDGGLKVVFAGPRDFRGTSSGKYRSEQDELWIRATSGGRIDKGGTGYGGLQYVITHELGHRYERKHHVQYDFDRSEWQTSRYSSKDGEAFAELFAISNFGITGPWPRDRVERFEKLMGG
jgi:hypothetical protein